MGKEELFELIRKNEVILFCGAGISISAGYPSGKSLTEMLRSSLTEEEMTSYDIDGSTELMDISEAIETMKGRHFLQNLLLDIFNRHNLPKISLQRKIARIPQIRTIITTNYDFLFEDAYKDRADFLFTSDDLHKLDSRKVSLFKIHGDPEHPEQVVISRNDYAKFYNNSLTKIFWDYIKSILATKTILFIGYSLKDINVRSVSDYITSQLSDRARTAYFVAPKQKTLIQKMLADNRMIYIDSDGECFINELLKNIDDNIIADIQKKRIDTTIGASYLQDKDVYLEISTATPVYSLLKVGSISGNSPNTMQLMVKANSAEGQEFEDFRDGKRFGKITLPANAISDIKVEINGIKIPSWENIQEITFQSIPHLKGDFDLKFQNEFEVEGLKYQAFTSPHLTEFEFKYKECDFKLTIQPNTDSRGGMKLNVSFNHLDICKSVRDEIKIFSLFVNILSGGEFTAYLNNEEHKLNLSKYDIDIEYPKSMLKYFEALKAIEDKYAVKFVNFSFNSITEDHLGRIFWISQYLDEEEHEMDVKDKMIKIELGFDATYSEEKLQYLFSHTTFENYKIEPEIEVIHKIEINLGYPHIKAQGVKYLNKSEVLQGKTKGIIFTCDRFLYSQHRIRKNHNS